VAIDTKQFYKENKYCVIKNFLSKEMAYFLYSYALMRARRAATFYQTRYKDYRPDLDGTYDDKQAPKTYSCYADPAMETLLDKSTLKMREIAGLQLEPTYSYWRLYKPGDVLKRHKDRPSCEVSTTLFLGHDITNLFDTNYRWPMYIDSTGGFNNKGTPIYLNPGDMIVYRGCEVEHWRDKFEGNNHAQVFLHYNDINGPYKDYCKYDARPHLGLPVEFRSETKKKLLAKVDIQLNEQHYVKRNQSRKT
jgi:hypothetical protein